MKKLICLCLCICCTVTAAGCTAGDLVEKYIYHQDPDTASENVSDKPRIYMDEVTGMLQDFTGSQLTLKTEEQTYTFDVSQATLECSDGMISGDEISVIYEGQLSDTGSDTSTVKALKVVDEFHKTEELKDRTAHCAIVSLTPNTITIKAKNGKTATYPITGTQQYYQNGIAAGNWVYVHFKGKFGKSGDDASNVLDASHVKVVSISDIDPIQLPDPTPTPEPSDDQTEPDPSTVSKQFRGVIQSISNNVLQVLPNTSSTSVNLDLSQMPCYFPGGIAPGSGVSVYYTGEDFSGESLEGLSVSSVSGDNPDNMSQHQMNFTVSGTILGTTANTVTIQTGDGAVVTCLTENAQNTSTSGLALGAGINITFDPALSRESNIYTSIKIQDA